MVPHRRFHRERWSKDAESCIEEEKVAESGLQMKDTKGKERYDATEVAG